MVSTLNGYDLIMSYQERKKEQTKASVEQKKLFDAKKKLAELEKDIPKKLSLSPDDEAKIRFLTDQPHVSWRVNGYSIGRGYTFHQSEDEANDYIRAHNLKNSYGKFVKPQIVSSYNVVLEDLNIGEGKREWLMEDSKRPSPEDFVANRVGKQHIIQFAGDDVITVMQKHQKKNLLSRSWVYSRVGSGTDTRYTLEDEDEKTPMPKDYKKIELYDLNSWVFPPDPEGLRTIIQQQEAVAFARAVEPGDGKQGTPDDTWG